MDFKNYDDISTPYASSEHKIIVIIIQIQMNKLAYIPTKTDKHKIYAEIE
jgi:hypothetical protein